MRKRCSDRGRRGSVTPRAGLAAIRRSRTARSRTDRRTPTALRASSRSLRSRRRRPSMQQRGRAPRAGPRPRPIAAARAHRAVSDRTSASKASAGPSSRTTHASGRGRARLVRGQVGWPDPRREHEADALRRPRREAAEGRQGLPGTQPKRAQERHQAVAGMGCRARLLDRAGHDPGPRQRGLSALQSVTRW